MVLALVRRARQLVLWSALAGFLGSLGGLAYIRYLTWKQLYLRRLACFWWSLGPIVLHYRWALRAAGTDEEREKRIQELHVKYAPVVRKVLGELRGMYTKVAQVASIAPNFLPLEYKREFQGLQNETTPAAWLAIRGVIEEDLGAPMSQLFERFERQPLGCASIGQAHLATWKGRQIVLKVQYPEAAENLRADFDCIEAVARMNIKKDKDSFALKMAQKCRKQFEKELDYGQEASHLQCLHDCINAAPEFHGKVFVPAPIPELTRGRVLAMDFVPGPKLADIFIARLQAAGMDALANNMKSVMEAMGESAPVDTSASKENLGAEGAGAKSSSIGDIVESVTAVANGAKADEVPAAHRTFAWLSRFIGPQRALVVMAVAYELKLRYLRCRGRLAPGSSTHELRQKLHLVLHLQGFQLFFCPVFNGDPHPGNFLAVPDGRVGIIDLGQCVHFNHKVKLGFANLILALTLPETRETNLLVADIVMSMGARTERGDKEYLAFVCRFLLTGMRPELMLAAEYLSGRDEIVDQPIEVFFISRVSALLRGFGLFMAENVDVAKAWAPWAERWLRENGEPTFPRPVHPDRKWRDILV